MAVSPFAKLIITSTVMLSLFAAAIFFYIRAISDIAANEDMLIVLEEKIAQLQHEQKRVAATGEMLQRHTQDIERVRNYFVDKNRPIIFIEELERAARETKNLITLVIEEGKQEDKTLFFRVTFDGTESSVRHALLVLDRLPYQGAIASISYQRTSSPIGADSDNREHKARLVALLAMKTI